MYQPRTGTDRHGTAGYLQKKSPLVCCALTEIFAICGGFYSGIKPVPVPVPLKLIWLLGLPLPQMIDEVVNCCWCFYW